MISKEIHIACLGIPEKRGLEVLTFRSGDVLDRRFHAFSMNLKLRSIMREVLKAPQ
jgi:hypothetical protein